LARLSGTSALQHFGLAEWLAIHQLGSTGSPAPLFRPFLQWIFYFRST
jgi:hypothetical protein